MENVISERQDASMRRGLRGIDAKLVKKAKKEVILHVLAMGGGCPFMSSIPLMLSVYFLISS